MAETEPSELFAYETPVEGANMDAKVVRDNFTALAQSNYTTDDTKPLAPRNGMQRANASDPNNIKLEVYLDGNWRPAVQNLQTGIAAPAKQIFQVPGTGPLAVWTIDHNLGARASAQVFTSSWFQMQSVDQFQEEIYYFGRVDLATLAGASVLSGFPTSLEGSFLSFFATTPDGVTAAAAASFQWEVDKTPSGGALQVVGGGPLVIPAGPHAAGTVFPGPAVVAPNTFSGKISSPGDVLNIIASGVTPGAGSVELYARVARTLGPGEYRLEQPTDNRIIVTHPEPRSGFVVVVG